MDVDIDFYDRTQILNIIDHIPAAIVEADVYKKHNTGVYVQSIPFNPLTGTASIDYKLAEQRGYFKIDFLNVSLYKNIQNEQHLTQLMNKEPLWELLEQDEFTDMLFHVNGHGKVLRTMKPKTLEQLAAVLAMIRPAKRYLIGKDWNQVMSEIWTKPTTDEYFFKRSHAISYASLVIVHMNLLCEQLDQEVS